MLEGEGSVKDQQKLSKIESHLGKWEWACFILQEIFW